jgi:hypothetical protein
VLDPLQQVRVFLQGVAAVGFALRGHRRGDELGKGLGALGLMAVELDDVRQVFDVAKDEIDRARPHAVRDRVAPHAGEKAVPFAFRRHGLPAPQRDRQQRSGEQCPPAHAERHHQRAPAITFPERVLHENVAKINIRAGSAPALC